MKVLLPGTAAAALRMLCCLCTPPFPAAALAAAPAVVCGGRPWSGPRVRVSPAGSGLHRLSIDGKAVLPFWVKVWAPEFGGRIGFMPPEMNELVLSIKMGCADTVPFQPKTKHPVLTRPISNPQKPFSTPKFWSPGWFSPQAKPTLAQNISSPGAWQAKGVGKMGDPQHLGVGWYRRQLVVPPIPAGGSLWLWIGGAPGGVLRSANVYANDMHVGRHVGYVDPLEMEPT